MIKEILRQSEDGQSMVEYALVIGLIVVAAVASFGGVADKVIELYQYIFAEVNSVM